MTVQEWETVLMLIDRGINTAPELANSMGWERASRDNRENRIHNILKRLEKWGKVERAGHDGPMVVWRRRTA